MMHTRHSLGAVVFLAASLVVATPAPVLAGVFSVSPLRIYMRPTDRAVAVTITNQGSTDMVLQADLNAWSQKPDGTDEQVPTEDLMLSPPIIRLAAGARQVVRLARLMPADANRQLIYRMTLREVPEALASQDKTIEVPIGLALSLPVFITPPPAKREMDCTAARSSAQSVAVGCSNQGSAYAQVRDITLLRGEHILGRFEGGTYILPGARKIMGVNGQQAIAPGPAQLHVLFDDGKSQAFSIILP